MLLIMLPPILNDSFVKDGVVSSNVILVILNKIEYFVTMCPCTV